ncbi:MAG: ABC transporter permease [Candidatus Phlomobacter fragariae]
MFNPAAISQHFIISGADSIIITIVSAILTSLVVAHEWKRGTMEALLSSQITRKKLLLSKLLPYQLLGIFIMLLCMLVTVFVLHIPYHGSLWLLFIITSLYLATTLGIGLLISTLTRNQFNAAIVALNAAFFTCHNVCQALFLIIDSILAVIQWVTYFIPARYFVSILQTLFLAGDIYLVLLLTNFLLLVTAAAIIFIGLTALKTRHRLN